MIKDPDNALSLEMACALLNNNVECYDQSLTFVEEVQVRPARACCLLAPLDHRTRGTPSPLSCRTLPSAAHRPRLVLGHWWSVHVC